jgi:ABC-type phosphate transport system ATPase subunit
MWENHTYSMSKSYARNDPGARVEGQVLVDGADIYDKSIDPVVVKRRVGMVFQKTKSVSNDEYSG